VEVFLLKLGKRSIVIAIIAAAFGLMWGMEVGSISGALLFLKTEFSMSPFQISLVTTAVSAGTVAGALTGGIISDLFGRRKTLIGIAFVAIITTILSSTAQNIEWLSIVRLFLGYVLGITLVVSPAFISESTRAEVRGRLTVLFQMCITTGIAVSYFVDLALAGLGTWRLMLGAPAILALILFILIFFLPDTPRWYVMKGRRKEALQALQGIYGQVANAEAQLQKIEQELAGPEVGKLSELFSGPLLRATIFGMGAGFFLQATGTQAIVYYSPSIIQSLGITSLSVSILFTALFQVIALLAVITSFRLVDRLGRRPLMLTGAICMTVGLSMLVIAQYVGKTNMSPVISVFALIGLGLFKVGNAGGFGALIYVFATELFPTRLRAKGAALTLFSTQLTTLAVAFLFPPVLAMIGGVYTFGAYAVVALGAFFFVYFLAPEFKGRSLEEIRAYWDNGGSWSLENAYKAIEKKSGDGRAVQR
jgi:SP family galactose:H+ symporter-like MFS transporter